MCVTPARRRSFQPRMRRGFVLLGVLLAAAGCSANGPIVARSPPSPSPTPTPSPSPSPSASASPLAVPAWAAMQFNCPGAPATQEALLVMQGSTTPVLADVTDARNPKTLCTITGSWSPQLVTQTTI